MLGCKRAFATLLLLATGALAGRAQPIRHELPKTLVPTRPLTKQERDRRESLKLYALGLLHMREDRIPEAVETFEQAAKLDPEASEIPKALIPLYVALDRGADALAATRKVLDVDADDYEVWFIYARQLKSRGKTREACTALERGLAVPVLKDHPEVAEPMYLLLGLLRESNDEPLAAVAAFRGAAKILDHPEALAEIAGLTRQALALRAAELYEKIGGLYLKVNKHDDAVAAYRQAQACYPDGAGRLNYNLALVFEKQRNLPEALKSVEGYLRLLPQGLEAYELKIKFLKALGRNGDILPWLEQATQNDRFNIGLKLLLAKAYVQARQTFQAESLYKELAAKSPSPEVYRGLFWLCVKEPRLGTGRGVGMLDDTLAKAKNPPPGPDAAAAQAQAMVAALRDDPELAKKFVEFAFSGRRFAANVAWNDDSLRLFAVLAERGKQLEEAESFYRECIRHPPPNTKGFLYSGLLRVLRKQRKFADIVVTCRTGLAQFPNASLFSLELALALAHQGKTAEALRELERGQANAPNDARDFRRIKISVLAMAERTKEAEAECRELLKESHLPGEQLQVHYMLSTVYSSGHQLARAEEQLQIVLKLDPSNATANNDLGYIWADQGKNLKRAEDMIRKAIDLDRQARKRAATEDSDEDNAAYIDSLGWVLFRRGQLESARRELERAITLPDGEDPTIYDHLGDVYYRLEQLDRARTVWQRALTLYERERLRTMDQKYKDLQRKYKLLDSARQP